MVPEESLGSIVEHFGELEDPRVDKTKRHHLMDIIAVTICGMLCRADSWVEIEDFGKVKYEWLRKFLGLPNGIPSHDTFGRVFGMLAPDKFAECFMSWVRAASELTRGQVAAIDGKSARGFQKI